MRRDDELGILRDHVLDHRNEAELAQRGERRFGLVEQIESSRNKAGAEQLQEALPVRVGVEVHAVSALERVE